MIILSLRIGTSPVFSSVNIFLDIKPESRDYLFLMTSKSKWELICLKSSGKDWHNSTNKLPQFIKTLFSLFTRGLIPWPQKLPEKSSRSRVQTMAPPYSFLFKNSVYKDKQQLLELANLKEIYIEWIILRKKKPIITSTSIMMTKWVLRSLCSKLTHWETSMFKLYKNTKMFRFRSNTRSK